ncbi:phytanoyl-CoA dioxygenase family protein [Cohnella soli]|uniref:Phytanoyl-CoA dioxygenase family protein n=1 Tax=Cohnella soli TaxID=425005 RepID=A0ABW0I7W8_9BACL
MLDNFQKLTDDKTRLEADGYVHIKNVVPMDRIQTINDCYHLYWFELIRAGQAGLRDHSKHPLEKLYPRVRDLHYRNNTIKEIILSTHVIELLENLIEERILIVSTSYYFKAPQTRGMPDHQDNFAIGAAPKSSYSMWISLDESDRENGGLRFYKGSHKFGPLPTRGTLNASNNPFSDAGQKTIMPAYSEECAVETAPGDVVVFHGDTIHGSYDNVSPHRFRRALLVHFAGASVERLVLNFNQLLDRKGERVRRRLNTRPMITGDESVLALKQAQYYNSTGWK